MIKYTKEYIAKLLDKYMDGTSTIAEMYPRSGQTFSNSSRR